MSRIWKNNSPSTIVPNFKPPIRRYELNVIQDSGDGFRWQFWRFALKDWIKELNYCQYFLNSLVQALFSMTIQVQNHKERSNCLEVCLERFVQTSPKLGKNIMGKTVIDGFYKYCQNVLISLTTSDTGWVLGQAERAFCRNNRYCVVPENIHTSPMEGIFFQHLPTPLEIPVKLYTFF